MTSREADSSTGERAPRIVQSVARAATLLKVLAAKGKPMGLGELAHSIETSKPATYHLLRTLELQGFVLKTEDAEYRLDWGLYEIGSSVVRSVNLTQVARLHLDKLAEDTGEAALLSVMDGHSVLYLDRGQSTESFTMVANVGRRSPLHTNASGKVLLAYQGQDLIASVLSDDLVAKTPSTICDPERLRAQLVRVVADGYATCWQEQELGLCSVAAPIFDHTGTVSAALAIAGPAERVTKKSAARFARMLIAEASTISTKLGWSPAS